VVDAGSPRNRFAAHMHGVLGNEGAAPADLLSRGRAEAASYGVEFVAGAALRVYEIDDGVAVTIEHTSHTSAATTAADQQETLHARALIVATGITDELPDIPGLAERWGQSVLHCPYCHGWEVRDRRLGVLTTSPLGIHQAQLVRQWSDDVVVFTAGLGALDPAMEKRLRARGIELVAAPVTEVIGDGDRVTGVRTSDGRVTPVDAIFTAGLPRPHDGFLAHLDLARTASPFGPDATLTVDFAGKTSGRRIWAIGNVVNPTATVPMSIGAGATTGGAVNAALVEEDFDRAVATSTSSTATATATATATEKDASHV
jgi:thioredoxin reductase